MPFPSPETRWALTPPFHPCLQCRRRFVFCGAFPRVAPAGRYPAPSSSGVRTFLAERCLRGHPTVRAHCNLAAASEKIKLRQPALGNSSCRAERLRPRLLLFLSPESRDAPSCPSRALSGERMSLGKVGHCLDIGRGKFLARRPRPKPEPERGEQIFEPKRGFGFVRNRIAERFRRGQERPFVRRRSGAGYRPDRKPLRSKAFPVESRSGIGFPTDREIRMPDHAFRTYAPIRHDAAEQAFQRKHLRRGKRFKGGIGQFDAYRPGVEVSFAAPRT